ncbi:hypothetical protein HPB48_017406 [Haemaphysalis longicornis]|uniref:Uncharacterized protein n=1 Tax=Haemaphysalis longicornis TaxID=44386 RepID=A0A9J6GGX2_HAELO|nr:hypothetical protein HPB48_017406 [Haemaphysalis longicornis]
MQRDRSQGGCVPTTLYRAEVGEIWARLSKFHPQCILCGGSHPTVGMSFGTCTPVNVYLHTVPIKRYLHTCESSKALAPTATVLPTHPLSLP